MSETPAGLRVSYSAPPSVFSTPRTKSTGRVHVSSSPTSSKGSERAASLEISPITYSPLHKKMRQRFHGSLSGLSAEITSARRGGNLAQGLVVRKRPHAISDERTRKRTKSNLAGDWVLSPGGQHAHRAQTKASSSRGTAEGTGHYNNTPSTPTPSKGPPVLRHEPTVSLSLGMEVQAS